MPKKTPKAPRKADADRKASPDAAKIPLSIVQSTVERTPEPRDQLQGGTSYRSSPPKSHESSSVIDHHSKSSLLPANGERADHMPQPRPWRQRRPKNPWSCSRLVLVATALATVTLFVIIHAFLTRQLDPKGCGMCWSRPLYVRFNDFDTEHTRFATKYSLYMIKEGGIDEDSQVCCFSHRILTRPCLR